MRELPRIGIVCDFQEENWPSMDLVAAMILDHLQRDHSDSSIAWYIRPMFRRRLTRQFITGGKLFNTDRFINRFWDYPRAARQIRAKFDLFHVIDHSYGQLLHDLPVERTIVTCHDLDTFQCLLNPAQEPRSVFFRKMMERTLSGFRKAAFVTCDSIATRDQILAFGLVPPDRTAVIPLGVDLSCSPHPDSDADAEAASLIGSQSNDYVDILHVGSTIPRKRIDVLLQVFSGVKRRVPNARLLRVGGPFTPKQTAFADELNLLQSILPLPHISRDVLAAVYRRAALVLQPSEREGFGFPVVEAMACGTPVVASGLPVLREVGGSAAEYCKMGDIEEWTKRVVALLEERENDDAAWHARKQAGLLQSDKFTWAECARKMVNVYQTVLKC